MRPITQIIEVLSRGELPATELIEDLLEQNFPREALRNKYGISLDKAKEAVHPANRGYRPPSSRGGTKNRETTVYQDEMIRTIAKDIKFSQRDVQRVIDAFVDATVGAMSNGYTVSMPNFGRFLLKYRSAKQYKHPTHGWQEAPEREIPHFVPARDLRKQVDHHRGRGWSRHAR